MKMLFASDSFKGSLTAVEICDLLQEAAADIFPDAETVSLPIADGGEGTVDALLCAMRKTDDDACDWPAAHARGCAVGLAGRRTDGGA